MNAPQSKNPQQSPGYASAFPQSFRPNLPQIWARDCEGYFLTGPFVERRTLPLIDKHFRGLVGYHPSGLRGPCCSCHPQSRINMNIQLNGEQHEIQAGMSVAALLRQLEIREDQVAVEVNMEIMDKKGFETRLLQDGDRIEVMSFIGGG